MTDLPVVTSGATPEAGIPVDPFSLAQCHICPLRGAHTPVRGRGPDKARVVLVGEAPGREEISSGRPFIGQSGRLVDAIIKDVGMNAEDVYLTNATLCCSMEGGKPPEEALAACRPRLLEEVKQRQAQYVIPLGAVATQSTLRSNLKISSLAGTYVKGAENEFGVPLLPTYHPAAVLRGAFQYFDDIHRTFKRVQRLLSGTARFLDLHHNPAYRHCITSQEVQEALDTLSYRASTGGRWILDLETDGLRYLEHDLLQIGIYDGTDFWVLEHAGCWRQEDGTWWDNPVNTFTPVMRAQFRGLLMHPRIYWGMHNKAFDLQFLLQNFGVMPQWTFDTMARALGLSEKAEDVGLKKLAREHFNAPSYEEKLSAWWKAGDQPFSQIPRTVMARYLALDLYYTDLLERELTPQIKEEGTYGLCVDLLEPAQRCFAKAEYRGVKVDLGYVDELRRIWNPRIDEARRELSAYARAQGFDARDVVKKPKSNDFNPASPKQVAHLAFDLLGLRPVDQRKKRSTDKHFLEKYEDHPFCQKLTKYRTYTKMMQTYVDGIADDVWWDGRVHPDQQLFGTKTGRLAIKNPPLQTIPKEERLRAEFNSTRKLFCATNDDWVIVEADYRQLEFRMGWHYSEDEAMGVACMSGDFHRHSASKIFHKPLDEITDEERDRSKFVTFGIMYGRQAMSLAKGELQCQPHIAQLYIDSFFKGFPKFGAWWHGTQKFAVENGYLVTTTGRKRRWGLITPKNLQEVKNQAVNFPLQSLASDLNLMSMIKLQPLLEKSDIGAPLFPVHDAIIFEIRKSKLVEAIPIIKRTMETCPFKTCATFEVDIKIGPNWGELTKAAKYFGQERWNEILQVA